MIDTKAIRYKILDLAVRGKLTEQLPEDGTAEELYRQIQTEKQTLIKAGKIKKGKPLPEISQDEIPFEIPNNWKWVRWGNLSYQIQYGYNAPAQEKGRIKMVRITDIQNNKVLWKAVPFCDIDEENIGGYLLRSNNILFARTGGTVGKSFLVENVEEEAVFAGYLIRTSFSSELSAKYLKFFMDSRLYWKQLQDGTTATAQPNCNANTLSKMLVPLPPLTEQKRIVEKIEQAFSVLDTIDELQKTYADNMTVLKSKLIDLAIQGKLTEQLPEDGTAEELYQQIQAEKQNLIKAGKIKKDKPLPEINKDEIPFEIPDNWKWTRFGTILQVISGVSYEKSDVSTSGLRILRGGNIQNMKIILDSSDVFLPIKYKDEEKTIHKGDVVIVASTGSEAVIGKPGYVEEDDRNTMIGAFLRICRSLSLSLSPFIHILFMSEYYRQSIRQKAKGTNINNVKENYITHLLVPLPPLAEQKRIVALLDNIMVLFE